MAHLVVIMDFGCWMSLLIVLAYDVVAGTWYVPFCAIIQYINLVGTGIGYTVTAGIAVV